MKSMTDPVFVDTNVFVYAADAGDAEKQHRASLWLAELWRSRLGRISFQVLQEFFVTVTHKKPDIRDQASAQVRDLLAWRPVVTNALILEQAWRMQDRFKLSFWDAMIVASARVAECPWLLTEDLQAGQNLDGVTVVHPFRQAPGQLPDR
jgi:predicted nucleic acid-binding protein